jgi:RNA polymerase sigma-70 factor (ECF subfamily)
VTTSDLAAAPTADFAGLIAPHWDVLVRVAGRLAAPGSRDDVLQEALTTAWRRQASYDPDRGSVRAWLLVITADQARRSWRRYRIWHPLADELPAAAPDPAVRADTETDIEAAVRRLPRRQRLAVQLRYYADLDVDDIAAVMRCSAGTVKSTLHDARCALRARLGEDYR